MTAILNPYLSFRGTAREAMEFYRTVFGGELSIMTFGEMGDPYPGESANVMHGQLETPSGFTLMGADVPSTVGFEQGRNVFQVSLSGAKSDEAELWRYWDGLAEGARITEPMAVAPWGATFGMLRDRFGIDWLVNISAEG
ncbi:MAG TPA: VOC family protein [Pseudolysinimonas sp.]|nr:VOC family protein [Pseudolysinimonas sp.]